MYHLYKIKQELLSNAALRTIKYAFKIITGIGVVMLAYMLVSLHSNIKIVMIAVVVYIASSGLALLLGYTLLKSTYHSLSILLDDEGVEFHIRGNAKKIKWKNLCVITKSSNRKQLQDDSVSSIIRFLTGEGVIPLIPEVDHYDHLLEEISKYKNDLDFIT